VEAFAQFGSDNDASTQHTLHRGVRLMELNKQQQYAPLPIEYQVIFMYAGMRGFLDKVPVSRIRTFEQTLIAQLTTTHRALVQELREARQISSQLDTQLQQFFEGTTFAELHTLSSV